MLPREKPRAATRPLFEPDLQFQEADYYLKDVAAASSAAPIANPAVPISRVGNASVEFRCIDGVFPVDSAALYLVTS